jgi:hypothetical protein
MIADGLIAQGRFRAFPGAMVGMKPPTFAEWMFRLLGASRGDTLDDLFPGSGAITVAWTRFTDSAKLQPPSSSPDNVSKISTIELSAHPDLEVRR